MDNFKIRAHWDAEARVWWAESDDVPGLVAEAGTHEELVADLRLIVPELLELSVPHRTGAITLHIISDRMEQVSYA